MKLNNKLPLVTVYITNYNYGNYIQYAIESVLNQTIQNLELIIIDDGSTDNSKTIIEKYRLLSNVSIIYQKNKGLNITNNIALKISKGKYIMRLDADDFLDKVALKEMASILESDDELGLIFPNYYIVDENGNHISEIKRHDFASEVSILDQPAHGACTMIRTKFLKQIGGYDESYSCQDGYELWVKFINKFKVININQTLFSYRRHNNNLTNNENRILETRLKIKQAYVNREDLIVPKTVAIIPIKNGYDLAIEKVGNKTYLDYKIDELLRAENISKVIITSSNNLINKYINENYDHSVHFIQRPEALERANVSLFYTLEFLHENNFISNFESIIFCSVSYPFINKDILNDAINTLIIFKADSLISVRSEDSKFFRHTGSGMKAILQQDKFTKLEREALYKYCGGLILVNKQSSLRTKKLVHGNVGHIVINEKAALNVESNFVKQLSQYLLIQDAKII